ncbi:MAG: DUF983 domain-containing protein [Pirellulales bacterium]|nr:DUF983 domain-containing protein [Planctomycetales bacterium]
MSKTRPLTILMRSLRQRCPACGRGRVFDGWLAVRDECEECGLTFNRGPGFYLGAVYFNYGVTALVTVIVFFTLYLGFGYAIESIVWPLFGFCLVFPLLFHRIARSLWLGFDELFDPHAKSEPSAEDNA